MEQREQKKEKRVIQKKKEYIYFFVYICIETRLFLFLVPLEGIDKLKLERKAMMKEPKPTQMWVPVPGFEGLYEISRFGDVRRIYSDHKTKLSKDSTRFKHGVYGFRKDGRQYTFNIDKLMWEAFYGEKPTGGIIHINNVKTDHSINNLKMEDCSRQKTKPPNSAPVIIIAPNGTTKKVRSIKEAARILNVPHETLRHRIDRGAPTKGFKVERLKEVRRRKCTNHTEPKQIG